MNGAESFLATLRNAGVRYLFGLPGTTEVGLLDVLPEQDEIQYILTLHESIAVAMAEGYARASGTIGVANVHSTVGTGNTLSMLMNAYTDQVPVVVTAGTKDDRCLGTGVFCDAPYQITELLRQHTKWSWQVLDPAYVGRDLAKAIRLCQSPIQGPVYLAIPENFWSEPSQASGDLGMGLSRQFRADAGSVQKAVEWLHAATRPVLMVGNEIGKVGALEEAVAFAETWQIPVVTEDRKSWNYINFPMDHPLYMGPFNHKSDLIKKADLFISIGNRLFMPITHQNYQYFSPETRIVQVHSDASRIGTHVRVDLGMISEARAALQDLLAASRSLRVDPGKRRTYLEEIVGVKATKRKVMEELIAKARNAGSIKVHHLVDELSRQASADAALINEGVRSGNYIQDFFNFTIKRTHFAYNGGSLGWGLPGAMGVKLAKPEREVIAFLGDGSFLFTPQSLWTAAHYGIDVKVIICNNKAYMAVKGSLISFKGRAAAGGRFVGTDFSEPAIDYAALCKGFGVPAWKAASPAELPEKIHRLLSHRGIAVLEVVLDPKDMETIPE